MTAPCGSFTVPTIPAVTSCANALEENASTQITRPRHVLLRMISPLDPCTYDAGEGLCQAFHCLLKRQGPTGKVSGVAEHLLMPPRRPLGRIEKCRAG